MTNATLARKSEGMKTTQESQPRGISSMQLNHELTRHGLNPIEYRTMQMVPPVMVAWADGKVDDREREQILRLASLSGIREDSKFFWRLEKWLEEQPPESLHRAALACISATLRGRPQKEANSLAVELHARCTHVASASRSFYQLGPRISKSETEALSHISREMRPFTYSGDLL